MPVLEVMEELKSLRGSALPHHEVSCDCERCNLAKTLSLENLRGIIGNENLGPGIYGPRGWTVMDGITTLTLPYSDWMWPDLARVAPSINAARMIDYLPYFGADAWLASRLLDRLPGPSLDERQNYAPKLESILKFVCNHWGKALFSGYLIGPQRFDERLSADALYVSTDLLGVGIEAEDNPEAAYRALLEHEQLDPEGSPDEVSLWSAERVHAVGKESGEDSLYWRFWWD